MAETVLNLTFHGIGEPPAYVDAAEREFWVSANFLTGVLDRVQGLGDVRVTFDDGNVSDYEVAFPELIKREMTADFMLVAGRIDQPGYLSTEQIHEMRDAGMRFGSQGFRHVSWRNLPPETLDEEIAAAKTRIEETIGAPIQVAACPFGDYDRRVLFQLKGAGFSLVFTSDRGWARRDQWLQCRNTFLRTSVLDHLEGLLSNRSVRLNDLTRWTKTFFKRLR